MTSALQDNPGSETSDTEGKNKGQKRKRSSNFDSPFYEKRRSARVSNSQKVNMLYFIPDVTCSCKLIYVEMFMYFDTFLKFIIKKLYDFQMFNVTMICSRIYRHILFSCSLTDVPYLHLCWPFRWETLSLEEKRSESTLEKFWRLSYLPLFGKFFILIDED